MLRSLESIKAQAAIEVLNEEAMIIEENEIKEAILSAENTCKELILFDPQDLTQLKRTPSFVIKSYCL